MQNNFNTKMIIIAFLKSVKLETNRPIIANYLNKLWHIQIIKYRAIVKKNLVELCLMIWKDIQNMALSGGKTRL